MEMSYFFIDSLPDDWDWIEEFYMFTEPITTLMNVGKTMTQASIR